MQTNKSTHLEEYDVEAIKNTIEGVVNNDSGIHSYNKWNVRLSKNRQVDLTFVSIIWKVGNNLQAAGLAEYIEQKGSTYLKINPVPTQEEFRKYTFLIFSKKY